MLRWEIRNVEAAAVYQAGRRSRHSPSTATRKMTLDYGLRYDFSTYLRDVNGYYGIFDTQSERRLAAGCYLYEGYGGPLQLRIGERTIRSLSIPGWASRTS